MYAADEVYTFLIKRLKHPKADRSFLNDKYQDIAAWREETVPWIKSHMHYSPEIVDFSPIETDSVDFGTYERKRIYFYSAEDSKVSCFLLVPKNIDKPAPAIVCLHDHSGRYYRGKEKVVNLTQEEKEAMPDVVKFQRWRYGGRGIASAMAERGYVVLVIDSLGWGERGWLTETWLGGGPENFVGMNPNSEEFAFEYDKAWNEIQRGMQNACLAAGTTYLGIQIWDDMRSVDFLKTLDIVDKDNIGCLGLSMGGFRTTMLGALDSGIKCSCPVGWMPRLQDITPRRMPGASFVLPGIYNSLPYQDLAALMAPRPMLVLNCENDKLFDMTSMEQAAETIASAYKKAGASDKFEAKAFPIGHGFDCEMQEYAFDWLDKHLKEDLRV